MIMKVATGYGTREAGSSSIPRSPRCERGERAEIQFLEFFRRHLPQLEHVPAGPLRLQPRKSPLRQTGWRRHGDSNRRSLSRTSRSLRRNGKCCRGGKGSFESVVYLSGDRGFESPPPPSSCHEPFSFDKRSIRAMNTTGRERVERRLTAILVPAIRG